MFINIKNTEKKEGVRIKICSKLFKILVRMESASEISFGLFFTIKKYFKTMRIREWCIIPESDTGILGNKSECSYQESNLRPSDY